MSDQNAPTMPPPPSPSPDAVYVCETLLKRISAVEARVTKRLIAIERHMGNLDRDSKMATEQLQSFNRRLTELEREVHQQAANGA